PERPARPRFDDGPGGGQRGRGVPGADRIRRNRSDETRRRRPRRCGALGPGGDRQASQARLDRREARPARVVPPRPDGLADSRHGRRPDADREGRGGGRGGRAGGDGEADARRRVHVRRLPRELQDAPAHGLAEGSAFDDPRDRQPAEGARDRRARAGPRRGDDPVDDPAGAGLSAYHRRFAAPAHRPRERHYRPGGLASPERAQGDAEADEADGTGQDAHAPANHTEVRNGSTDETDPGRVEEEPDLPGRGRGLPLAARREVHRDRRALQPPDRSLADRVRRGEGEGLALQGRAALGRGLAAPQSQKHRLMTPTAELVEYLARRLVEKPD